MRKSNVHVMYYPSVELVGKASFIEEAEPAQWAVAVDFMEDNNPMSASMHEFAFVAKPTKKQVRKCKRKALIIHSKELEIFKKDYPHYF